MVVAQDYTDLSKVELYVAFSLVSSLFFIWGLSYGLLDVLNQHMLTIFHITPVETTMLQFAYFIAYFIAAPPMGFVMNKIGYKRGIHIGLTLFSIGAVLFWPSAVYRKYGMFVAFTFVAASGLATLEVAANTYITVLGPPKHAAFRLTFAQVFNGGANQDSLDTVQYVYLALSCFALLVNIGLCFCRLPEVRQAVTHEQEEIVKAGGWRGFLKNKHTIWGAFAEFCYVGAQVAVASNAIFYMRNQPGISPPWESAFASNMFSACQAVFTIGRIIGVGYLRYIDPTFALFVHGCFLVLFSILTSVIDGRGGIVCLFFIFLFESVCYPVIYSVATANLGPWARIGGGLVAAGVSGGAWMPSAQAALLQSRSAQLSYLVPMTGFIPLTTYGLVMWINKCREHGSYSIFVKNLDAMDQMHIEEDIKTYHHDDGHPSHLSHDRHDDLEGKASLDHIEHVERLGLDDTSYVK